MALTPPKFQAKYHAAEEEVLLEKRLEQFVEWLNEREFWICDSEFYDISKERVTELIEEFVNT